MSGLALATFWIGAVLCLPAGFVLLEVVASLLPRRAQARRGDAPSTVVLIPAHNERVMLPKVLERLQQRAHPQMRIVVIADNCTDDTAAIARAAGVEVLERTHDTKRGKPHALAWALHQLAPAPPEVVVVLDADCWFERGDPLLLAQLASQAQRPVQGIYRMQGSSLRDFAFRFRGQVRLGGLSALGGIVPICGSGFAIPWTLLQRVPVPVRELAEDTVWGWRFMMAGIGTRYTTEVEVVSVLPRSASGVSIQQHRWEFGVVSSTVRFLPRLLFTALLPPRWSRILSILDLLVPPLALLVLLLLLIGGVGAVAGGLAGAATAIIGLALLTAAVGMGWWFYARKDIPLLTLLRAPWYAVRKIALYASFFGNHSRRWVRTDRDEP